MAHEDWVGLGEEFSKTKSMVPTRPHPSAPDRPPMQTVVGGMAAAVDKARDMAREFAESPQEQHQQQQHPRK